jgi:predicted TIM-barrel fold metal-dependent hydrolase
LLAVLIVSMAWHGRSATAQPAPFSQQSNTGFGPEELKAFAALHPIDAHTHMYLYDPAYAAFLSKLNLRSLDIIVVSDNGDRERKDLEKESRDVFEVVRNSGHRVYACTTFDAYRFNAPDFAANAIAGIDKAFRDGAVAVKLWKNVGMEIKNTNGNYILPDDPALTPIYRDIAAHHKTLIMHIADPDTAWLPPTTKAPDTRYYQEHPEWYMYRIPGSPSKDQILNARDHVLDRNPDLKIVGAHLGSMESDLPRLAADLDRHPNFAVDLTARMPYIMMLDRNQAIAFLTKYQDRLIYGTDDTAYPGADIAQVVRDEENGYARDWRFLATDARLSSRGIETRGLALPESILQKIYHDNAVRWYSLELTGQ